MLAVKKDFRKRHCGVPTCNTYNGGGGSFRMPEHPVRRNAWIKALNLPNTQKSVRICWKHFKITDFMKELDSESIAVGQFGQLKKNVVPTEFHQFKEGENSGNHFSEISDNSPNCQKKTESKNSELYQKKETLQQLKSKTTMEIQQKVVEKKLVFCTKCGDCFNALEDLSKHIEVKTECRTKENLAYLMRNYPGFCDFAESTNFLPKKSEKYEKEGLMIFSKNDNSSSAKYKCSICGDLYNFKSILVHHISQIHDVPKKSKEAKEKVVPRKPFRQVARIFERDKLLISFDDEKCGYTLYQCTICGDKYNAKSSVVTHIKKNHKGLEYVKTKLEDELKEKSFKHNKRVKLEVKMQSSIVSDKMHSCSSGPDLPIKHEIMDNVDEVDNTFLKKFDDMAEPLFLSCNVKHEPLETPEQDGIDPLAT